jgi:gliding motility-associated-like protein
MKMTTQDDKLGNLFREAFNNFEKTPSEGLWANIDAQFVKPVPAPKSFTRKSWFYAAGSVVIVAVTSIVLFYATDIFNTSKNEIVSDNITNSEVVGIESNSNVNDYTTPEADNVKTTLAAENSKNTNQTLNNLNTVANPVTSASVRTEIPALTPMTTIQNTELANSEPVADHSELQRIAENSADQPNSRDYTFGKENLTFPSDKIICKGEDVKLTAGGGISYYWNTGEMSNAIVVMPSVSTYYTVTVTNTDNTEAIHHVKVEVRECATLFIPDAFSPDGDGRNDEFLTFGTNISNYSIRIFSAFGQLMYESRDINTGWNGRFKGGDAPTDVYFYLVNFTDVNGQQHTRQGRLFLLR